MTYPAYAVVVARPEETTEDVKWKIEQAVRGCLRHVADPTQGEMRIVPHTEELPRGETDTRFHITWHPTAT